MTNKYQPHLLVIPEDDAVRQICNGFVNHQNVNQRVIQILPYPGGWPNVLQQFIKIEAPKMEKFTLRKLVLVIDFDQTESRLSYVQSQIPENLIDRVFILGVESQPEMLKRETQKSFEVIGAELAEDCCQIQINYFDWLYSGIIF